MNDWISPVLPLEGFRVLDLTRFLSGPYATMVLGDMGADVLKIERPEGGDDSRRMAPQVNGESYPFAMPNRNKRSLAVDLTTERGLELFKTLVAQADLVIENFRPGVTAKLGIDYAALTDVRPDLIYCSISGFGQTGPHRLRAGLDIIAQGVGGFMSMTGNPGDRPVKVGVAINDLAAGATAVQAILAAYIYRARTGQGQSIDLSLVDAGLAWTVWESGAYFGSGEIATANGSRHRRSAPYQAFRTQDGHVTVGANTERLWRRLCDDVLDVPEWIQDPRFCDNERRLANVEELEREIEQILALKPTAEWVDRLDAAGIPGGPLYTYDQALESEQVQARDMVVEVDHPRIGRMKTVGVAPKMSGSPFQITRPAPWLGQHSAQVLAELGLPPDEIDKLFVDGVVHDEYRRSEENGNG